MKVGQTLCARRHTKESEYIISYGKSFLLAHFIIFRLHRMQFFNMLKNMQSTKYGLNSIHNLSTGPHKIIRLVINYRVKANCPLVGPGPVGGVPSMGVFLRNPSPNL